MSAELLRDEKTSGGLDERSSGSALGAGDRVIRAGGAPIGTPGAPIGSLGTPIGSLGAPIGTPGALIYTRGIVCPWASGPRHCRAPPRDQVLELDGCAP